VQQQQQQQYNLQALACMETATYYLCGQMRSVPHLSGAVLAAAAAVAAAHFAAFACIPKSQALPCLGTWRNVPHL
jgi:hypothetical protein